MERRDLLKMISAATGAAMIGSNVNAYEIHDAIPLSKTVFKKDDVFLFNEIAEVIIPRTDTPGAKDANVGQIALVLANDCYTTSERDVLIKGLETINKQAHQQFTKPYLLLTSEQKAEFVQQLDKEAKTYNHQQGIYYLSTSPFDRNKSGDEKTPHYFTLIKQLTMFGFFTSEIGATKVLRYDPVPATYNGNLEYKKGDKAWATR